MTRAPARRTVAIVVVALIVVAGLGVLALWSVPILLTRHPETSGADRHQAIADARTGCLAFLALVGAAVSAVYAVRTYELSRRGQIADRYTKAVDQLGDESPDKCIGGIYALGRIMRDSGDEREAVVDVLAAFVRRRAMRRPDGRVPWPAAEAAADEIKPPARVQAALKVLARRTGRPGPAPDLRDTDLRGARLEDGSLARATFRRAALYRAHLERTDFTGATFIDADLRGAYLRGATFAGADFRGATVTRAG